MEKTAIQQAIEQLENVRDMQSEWMLKAGIEIALIHIKDFAHVERRQIESAYVMGDQDGSTETMGGVREFKFSSTYYDQTYTSKYTDQNNKS